MSAERLTRKPAMSRSSCWAGSIIRPRRPSPARTISTCSNSVGINVAFLSAAGVDAERGATCEHFHEAQVKQKVICLARENYLVVDSSKIGKLKRAFFAPMGAFNAMITEHGETRARE